MHEAKSRLSDLVAAAERGEDVVIARNGTPAARLVAITVEHAFDRVLIAHALQDDLSVLTRDVAFAEFGVALAGT